MAKISPSILSLEFFCKNSIYLRVRFRERFVNPQLLKQLAVYKIKELLILHGADVNHINGYGYYNSSIWLAKIANAYEAGKVLIKHGARFDIFDEIDNCYVTSDGTEHYENLDFLLKCGANPNQGTKDNIFSPLMYAVSKNNISAARLLLKYGQM